MKRLFATIVLLSSLLSLSACGNAPASSHRASTVDDVPVSEPLSLHMVQRGGQGTYNQSGFYELRNYPDASSNIIYTDFVTRQRVFLCGRPECVHDDDTCTSWVPPSIGVKIIYAVDEYVYVIYAGVKSPGASLGENAPPSVTRMTRNGANKKTVNLPSDMLFSGVVDGNIAYDDTYLYFSVLQYAWDADEEKDVFHQQIVSMRQDTLAIQTLFSVPYAESRRVIGVSSQGILLQHNSMSSPQDKYEGAELLQCEITIFHPKTQQEKVLYTFPEKEWPTYAVMDDTLYCYDKQTDCLFAVDAATGRQRTILSPVFPNKTYIEVSMDRQVWGGCLAIVARADDESDPETYTFLPGVDTGLRQTYPLRLPGYELSPSGYPVAETDAGFMVITGEVFIIMKGIGPDGVTEFEFESPTQTYGIITKEDYWAGNANVVPVQDMTL